MCKGVTGNEPMLVGYINTFLLLHYIDVSFQHVCGLFYSKDCREWSWKMSIEIIQRQFGSGNGSHLNFLYKITYYWGLGYVPLMFHYKNVKLVKEIAFI